MSDPIDTLSISIDSPATLREVGIHMGTISRKLDRVEAKMDAIQSQYVTRSDFEEHLKLDADQEERLRLVEKNQVRWGGAIALGSSILTILGSFVLQRMIG